MVNKFTIGLCVCAYHVIVTYVKQLTGKSYHVGVSPGQKSCRSRETWYK